MKDLNNSPTPSHIFGQTEGIRAYYRLVDGHPQLRDKRVDDIAVFALSEAMMAAGKTVQDIDRKQALSAILTTIDEQTVTESESNETG